MRWDQTEFIFKGLFLALLAVVGLSDRKSLDEMDLSLWELVARVGFCLAVGLALALSAAAYHKIREGFRVRGKLVGFTLFLLLENPGAVYVGIIGGALLGAYPALKTSEQQRLLAPILAGPILGLLFWYVRNLAQRDLRHWLSMGLAFALIVGPLAYLHFVEPPQFVDRANAWQFTVLSVLALVGFYLLSFTSLVEEAEVDVAALCGVLGICLYFLLLALGVENRVIIPAVIPLTIYYVYIRQVLPGLRVFKHALRGLSYKQMGQFRLALVSLNRALTLDPNHSLTREQLWDLHRRLHSDHLREDPGILEVINYDLCLDRVAQLLLQDQTPPARDIDEAMRLLDMIASHRPDLEPACAYWRCLAHLYQRNFDEAQANLESVLRAPQEDSPARRSVLFRAWHLALMLHPEMKRRVGNRLITFSDRKMEAIAALEREIAGQGNVQAALDLRPLVYSELSENDYATTVPSGQAAADFNHEHARELGLALIDKPDQWQRGCEYLRMAARGLPAQAPLLFIQIGKVHEKHGDLAGMWHNYQRGVQLGRAFGAERLPEEDRKLLFATVKAIGERAMKENQIDTALEAYKYFSQSGEAGIETWRTLAELFQRKSEAEPVGTPASRNAIWQALNCVEHALTYNASDPDLLERKDRLYYSITPAEVRERWESVQRWFDSDYCLAKAQAILESYGGNLDLLDWAQHLADLASLTMAGYLSPKLVQARVLRLRGETDRAIEIMEAIRKNKPEKFGGEKEEDAWYVTHRLLGDLYLETNPAEAVKCFLEFRKSSRAGADTSYKLGRAYEAIGENRKAAANYEEVLVFPEHPLYYDARAGLDRVRG